MKITNSSNTGVVGRMAGNVPASGVTVIDTGNNYTGTELETILTEIASGGLSQWKDPVRVATSAAGTLATAFENGDTVDGVVLATGDRILIKDQAAGAENGIYTVNASGAPTRATDMDAGGEVVGALVYAIAGTTNGGQVFRNTNTTTPTLGTTALTFAALPSSAVGGMVPYFIASGETYTVPIYKQAPFAMVIDNAGTLVVDGFLILVA